jgi:hypothetical protein
MHKFSFTLNNYLFKQPCILKNHKDGTYFCTNIFLKNNLMSNIEVDYKFSLPLTAPPPHSHIREKNPQKVIDLPKKMPQVSTVPWVEAKFSCLVKRKIIPVQRLWNS